MKYEPEENRGGSARSIEAAAIEKEVNRSPRPAFSDFVDDRDGHFCSKGVRLVSWGLPSSTNRKTFFHH